jgi:cytoskeleton protein RodZ
MPEPLSKIFKIARESKNLSMDEVVEKTRIPKKIISAIEEDNLNEVCSPFYAKSFLKTYSQFLGINLDEVFKQSSAGNTEDRKKKMDSQCNSAHSPGNIYANVKKDLMAFGNAIAQYKRPVVMAGVVIIGVWLAFAGIMKIKNVISKIDFNKPKEVSMPIAKKPQPQPENKKTKSIVEQVVKEEKESENDIVADELNKKEVEIELAVNSTSLVQVTGDGEILFKGIIRKGSREAWKAKKEIKLDLGNAGGVTISLNGKDLGPLGKKGQKKDNIVITKDGVK